MALKKSLYGALIAGLLFWWDMSDALVSWGFNPNPHDICVMNKTVDSKQRTIFWPLDDFNIFHVIPNLVGAGLSQLTTKYGKLSPLSFIRVRVREYLGMGIYFSTKGKVRITMLNRIKGILEEAAEEMNCISETPEANHLFTVQEDGGTLTRGQADLFRTLVEKILFVIYQSRPDLKMVLYFLTTQFHNTDKEDYKKLACMTRYTRAMQCMELTLEAESMDDI